MNGTWWRATLDSVSSFSQQQSATLLLAKLVQYDSCLDIMRSGFNKSHHLQMLWKNINVGNTSVSLTMKDMPIIAVTIRFWKIWKSKRFYSKSKCKRLSSAVLLQVPEKKFWAAREMCIAFMFRMDLVHLWKALRETQQIFNIKRRPVQVDLAILSLSREKNQRFKSQNACVI